MYIKRKLEATILEQLESKEIIAVVGPRQAGKTTMLKRIQMSLDSAIFLSFEDVEEMELFEQDIKSFAKNIAIIKINNSTKATHFNSFDKKEDIEWFEKRVVPKGKFIKKFGDIYFYWSPN
jgi:predicted AAA+ superfamily ATPase